MANTTDKDQAQARTAPGVDWIVLGANALGAGVVALAALTSKAEGVVQQIAQSGGGGAIF